MKNEEVKSQEPVQAAEAKSGQATPADFNYADAELSVVEMLKHGVHFGHKKSRWNPKMKPYTFAVRNDIHIIDLEKTLVLFNEALVFIRATVKNGGKILFVGTKPQTKRIIKQVSEVVGMPYVTNRWLGGTFTNFAEIKKRIKHLNDQEAKSAAGELEKYTKYEQSQFKKEIVRMNEKIGGIKKMDSLPQAMIVADIKENNLAVMEARNVKVPVIAITDTNTDPTMVNYPIPGNDDAISSLKYIFGVIVKNIMEAKNEAKTQPKQEETKK